MSIGNKCLSNMHTSDQDFEDIVYGFPAICPKPFPALTPTKSVYQLQEQQDPPLHLHYSSYGAEDYIWVHA